MKGAENATSLSILLVLALLLSLLPSGGIKLALAHPDKLKWSIVDTPAPDQPSNIIVSPSEINAIAIGSDGNTFYAADIPGDPAYPNGKVYKSTDGGVTWEDELTARLARDGASLPAWNIAVAPDDVNFVVAVTDGDGTPNGPKEVFVSTDGGDNWDDTNFSAAGDYISCVDVSVEYVAGRRDIAVGTRDGAGGGKVYVLKAGIVSPSWVDQGLTGDVVALRFSPEYYGDSSLVVISATAAGTLLNLGSRDIVNNTTTWNSDVNYPVTVVDTSYTGSSPDCTEIITADLELPFDFLGTDPNFRRYYVSIDAFDGVNYFGGIYRIDDSVVYSIPPPIDFTTDRISSIAYRGACACDDCELLAGEVTEFTTSPGKVRIWRTSNPTAGTPTWEPSDALKSPTGGGNSGYANAQVTWSPAGDRVYCATSSANPTTGGTGPWATTTNWPRAWLNGVALDESAFSVTLDGGEIWNQLSLIDTQISFLSDVAALEVPEDSEDYNVLYLASVNDNVTAPQNFDSVWRSFSEPGSSDELGETWERILCIATSNDGILPDDGLILRVKPRPYEEEDRSQVIVFADRLTDDVCYSDDEGQEWEVVSPGATVDVTDLALASDEVMYILDDTVVYRYEKEGVNWNKTHKIETYLDSGHTIATPLKNPEGENEREEDWVIVGDERGKVAYADFSAAVVRFEPPPLERIEVPVSGNMHVIADDRFEQNKIIYAASHDLPGTSGKIYRWVIDESTDWEELEPPNSAFYGLAQRNDVLYGVWEKAESLEITTDAGVDRTLFPRATVPPPLEWDDLTEGLPESGDANYPVVFTREPSSLKISSNANNNLWAIDNRDYDWADKVGCLWTYADTLAKVGPWTTSPASGDFIPVDPVSGRANEVNFRWRQLSYAQAYELQLAKDDGFSLRVLVSDNITPPEPLSPAWILTPGVLEANHTFYWRVRARTATTGEEIRSPWSATMFFTVKAGLPAETKHFGPTLLKPASGATDVPRTPAFSWSPIPRTTNYEFILAKDAGLAQVTAKVTVPTTAYEYDGKLDWNSAYFWQVRAIEPVVSEPSPVATFTVIAKEIPSAPSASPPSSPPSFWIWVAIAIYAALVAAIIVWVRMRPAYEVSEATDANKLSPIVDRLRNALANVKNAFVAKVKGISPSKDQSDIE